MHSKAFKLDRVILATDANPAYLEFWPTVAKAWKEIIGIKPTLALIATPDVKVDESLGEVIRFEPIPGVSTALYAQAIRLLLPAYFEQEICLVSDIDLVPLNQEYFLQKTLSVSDDCFVVYRDGAYGREAHKFPMSFVAAKGSTFKEVFALGTVQDIPALIEAWSNEKLGWYTDELMLHKYLTNWKYYGNRCIKLGHGVERRIDRSYWTYDREKLQKNYYIDAHCPRPYSAYSKEIDKIVEIAIQSKCVEVQFKKIPRCLEHADCGTHMAPLLTVVTHTDGPLLEMGSGDFSTPLLHAICSKSKRFLLTAETDKKWLHNFIDLKSEWHAFVYVPVYEDDWSLNPKPALWDAVGGDRHWAVVFIDHRPGERRVEDIRRLRKNTDIFVVHDTQQPSYCYEPVLNTFKYKYVYERYATQTTIVSDIIDVSTFFEK